MTSKPLAVISGGTGYLGSAIVEKLRAAEWTVAVLSNNDSGTDVYQCDVADESSVHAAVGKVVSAHGAIGACIHAAAAPLERAPLLSISAASFDASMNTAVRAAFLLAAACAPHMAKHAAFVGITTSAIEPTSRLEPVGAYIPSKYALRGFLRVLAAELKEARVYAVAPGFLPGGLNADIPQAAREFIARKSGTSESSVSELGALVLSLCDNSADVPAGSSVAFPSLAVSPL